MFGQQTPRRWGWGTPLKKRTAARTSKNYVMPGRLVNRKQRSSFGREVPVNCQLRRLRRVRFKMESGFSLPPVVPGQRLGVEAFKLEQALSAEGVPAAALAFEAALDVDLDVLFDGAGARLDGGGGAADGSS
jgi:hypothetical protein